MSPRSDLTLEFDNGIRIVPFERNHQEEVVDIFTKGLRSYALGGSEIKGLDLLTEQFLDDKLENDMKDIYTSYIGGKRILGNKDEAQGLYFFSALDSDDRVVGCVGINNVPSKGNSINTDECELVRMSVRQDCRGLGLGKKLVGAVEEFAVSNGYRRVCLSTLRTMPPAVALYTSCGYSIEKEYQIPMEKHLGPGDYSPIRVVFFYKDL